MHFFLGVLRVNTFSYISASVLALKEEDLSKVPYLQYCMAEAVRLHPVGIITRRVVKEFTIRVNISLHHRSHYRRVVKRFTIRVNPSLTA